MLFSNRHVCYVSCYWSLQMKLEWKGKSAVLSQRFKYIVNKLKPKLSAGFRRKLQVLVI